MFCDFFEAPRRVGSRPIDPAAARAGAEFGIALPHVIRDTALNLRLGDRHDGFIAPQAARERSQVLRGEGRSANTSPSCSNGSLAWTKSGERRLCGPDPPGAGQNIPLPPSKNLPRGHSVSMIVSKPIRRSHLPSRPSVLSTANDGGIRRLLPARQPSRCACETNRYHTHLRPGPERPNIVNCSERGQSKRARSPAPPRAAAPSGWRRAGPLNDPQENRESHQYYNRTYPGGPGGVNSCTRRKVTVCGKKPSRLPARPGRGHRPAGKRRVKPKVIVLHDGEGHSVNRMWKSGGDILYENDSESIW